MDAGYVGVFLLLAVSLVLFVFRARKIPGLAYPLPWVPFLGNTLELQKNVDNIFVMLRDYGKKVDGKNFGLSVPGVRTVFLTCPESIEYVLKTNFDNYEKGPIFRDVFQELLGMGIFTVDHDMWRNARKAASHMFSLRRLKDHAITAFKQHARTLIKELDKVAADKVNNTIEIQQYYYAYTFDAFSKIAFGRETHALSNTANPHPFPNSFDQLNNICTLRLTLPPFLARTRRLLRLGKEGTLAQHVKIIDETVREVIKERDIYMRMAAVEDPDQDGAGDDSGDEDTDKNKNKDENETAPAPSKRLLQRKNSTQFGADFLGLYLNAFSKKNERPSDAELRDVVLNFIIAGRDTTAWTMTAMTYVLSLHKDKLAKVQVEVDEVFRERATSGSSSLTPEYEDLDKLPYLEAVMMETLRLYPSVPVGLKAAIKPDVLPDGTPIATNDIMVYSSFIQGTLTSVWGDDAETFRPERWFEDNKPADVKYPIFNVGKRLCLGKSMATFEVKLIMAALLHRFDIVVCPGHDPTYNVSATLSFKHGLTVALKPRHHL